MLVWMDSFLVYRAAERTVYSRMSLRTDRVAVVVRHAGVKVAEYDRSIQRQCRPGLANTVNPDDVFPP
jgi:hypothetical protein